MKPLQVKHCLLLILILVSCSTAQSQYYLRGEVKDEKGRPLEGAKMYLASKGTYVFYSGMNGMFGLPSPTPFDSVTVYFDGYEVYSKN